MATTTQSVDPRALPLVEQAAAILREYGATEVYAYGSVVTGRWDPEWSDIDLAVRGVPPERFYAAGGAVMRAVPREVDVLDLDIPCRLSVFLEEEGDLVRVG